MARGKAAAQAANRRLAEAEERCSALEQRLAEQTAAHRAETNGLRVEAEQARSALRQEVAHRTDDVVREAREEAAARVSDARQDAHDRIITGIKWLCKALGDQIPRDTDGFAAAFGLQVSDVIRAVDRDDGVFNRQIRRVSNKGMRNRDSFHREVAHAGPNDVVWTGGGGVVPPHGRPLGSAITVKDGRGVPGLDCADETADR